jgi:hypothetical protein
MSVVGGVGAEFSEGTMELLMIDGVCVQMSQNPITGKPTSLGTIARADEEAFVPRLPLGWNRLVAPGPAFRLDSPGNPHHDLAAFMSVGRESDGRLWMHVSVSHPRRMPGWEDLQLVKGLFIGKRFAYQVHPPKDRHYTLTGPGRAGRVLHLWAPLEGDPSLPDFLAARGGTL